ncbi:GNAT family N-acetyltransferase [Actinopolymorpha alba]|uniref:GNAT family N-acetyltransferase n=1 Tax=Actinopolymorpha alba TaxID=533267 RepID=UPI000381CBFC|nr:GNAT family N-acetyltransferase [Actinopolymorpha alba]
MSRTASASGTTSSPDAGQPATGLDLALVAARGWPALTTERLGGWLLQAADGFTNRCNSVVPAGEPGVPLDQALELVRDFYAGHGLPALIQVVGGTPLEAELRARGWSVRGSGKDNATAAKLRVAPLREFLARAGTPAVDVEVTSELDADWLALYGRTTTPAAARHVLASPEQVALARIGMEVGLGLAGIGRGVVTGSWLGIAAIEVAPPHRRRGFARAVMSALGQWGRDRGASWAYLQVGSGNTAALALYDRLGFRTDHEYRYYTPPS